MDTVIENLMYLLERYCMFLAVKCPNNTKLTTCRINVLYRTEIEGILLSLTQPQSPVTPTLYVGKTSVCVLLLFFQEFNPLSTTKPKYFVLIMIVLYLG